MEKDKKLKLIGIGLCIPLVIMAIYLIFHLGVLLVAALTAISTALFVYGLKLAKGDSLEEVKKDFMDDIDDLRDKDKR